MASNCTNRVKYVDDTTVVEFIPRLCPSYFNFTVSEIYSFVFSRVTVLNRESVKKCALVFLQFCPFPPAPLLVGSPLIVKFSCYKLSGSVGLKSRSQVTGDRLQVTGQDKNTGEFAVSLYSLFIPTNLMTSPYLSKISSLKFQCPLNPHLSKVPFQ